MAASAGCTFGGVLGLLLRIVEMVLDTRFGVGTVSGLRTNEVDSDRNLAAPRPPVGEG